MMIKTDNLLLRHWKDSDAECLYHFASNPNVGPIAGWPPHESVDYSLNIIKTIFVRKECYAITINDIPIGCAELLIHPDGNHWWGEGSAELGYWIAEEYQGRGYATEASKALITRAFGELNIQRIYASFKTENLASKRVLEKLGFKYFTELNNMDYTHRVFREIAMVLEK
ncbi:GNAT family N-acetyltransferase [Methanobrevibacter sp.]